MEFKRSKSPRTGTVDSVCIYHVADHATVNRRRGSGARRQGINSRRQQENLGVGGGRQEGCARQSRQWGRGTIGKRLHTHDCGC